MSLSKGDVLEPLYKNTVSHVRAIPRGENREPWKRKVFVGRFPASDSDRDPNYRYSRQGVRILGK